MPTTQTVDPIGNDQEVFDSALSETPTPAPEATPEPAPEPTPEPEALAPVETTGGRLKDPVTGKFVAKGEKPQETAAPQESQKPAEIPAVNIAEPEEPEAEPRMPAQVPSWRLAEEAQRRRDAEAQREELTQQLSYLQMQIAQMQQQAQQPQEQIDPINDPEGYQRNVQATLQKEIAAIRLESNLQIAEFKYGDTFHSAYEAFRRQVDPTITPGGDQATYLRVMRSPNPGEAMVQWFKERETFAKIGHDPDAWLNSELEKRMADPTFQAEVIKRFQASQGVAAPSPSKVQIPTSLSGATAAAPAVGAPMDVSDAGIFDYALTAKR